MLLWLLLLLLDHQTALRLIAALVNLRLFRYYIGSIQLLLRSLIIVEILRCSQLFFGFQLEQHLLLNDRLSLLHLVDYSVRVLDKLVHHFLSLHTLKVLRQFLVCFICSNPLQERKLYRGTKLQIHTPTYIHRGHIVALY